MSKAHCSVRPFTGVKLIASVVEATLHLEFGGSSGIRPNVLTAVMEDVPLSALPAERFPTAVMGNVRLQPTPGERSDVCDGKRAPAADTGRSF